MIKSMAMMLMLVGLSACASHDRLMDAQVRPSDLAECTVGDDDTAIKDPEMVRSPRDRRCRPDEGLKWSSGQSRGTPMDVDFRKK